MIHKDKIIEYRNRVNEIFKSNKHSLTALLRELCSFLSEFYKKDKVVTHIHIRDREYICKYTLERFLFARMEIEMNDEIGIIEFWTSFEPEEVFETETQKDIFFQILDYIHEYSGKIQNAYISIESKDKFETESDSLKFTFYNTLKESLLREYNLRNYYQRDTSFDLMRFRVKEVLLIATLYDSFSIESEGNFSRQIFGEYSKLNLSSPPRITAVSSYKEAYYHLRSKHYDLVIIMAGVNKVISINIARKIRKNFSYLPVYFLLNNNADISYFRQFKEQSLLDHLFVWNGDSRIFLTMIKLLEDKINLENDTRVGDVRVILLVEDSPRYYSRYLPLLYNNVFKQIQRVIDEVVARDEVYKIYALRMRPKIILATNYEEAKDIFDTYQDYFLSLITDVEYLKDGEKSRNAGLQLASYVDQKVVAKIPIIIQSSDESFKGIAESHDFLFINKNSDTLAADINHVIKYQMGFGDFIFRDKEGNELGYRAKNLGEFIDYIKDPQIVPDDSIEYHALRNHFSLWLMAQGEVPVAKELAQLNADDFADYSEIREFLVLITQRIKYEKNKGKIVDFVESELKEPSTIVSLDSGALGGKGRGIAFIHTLIYRYGISELFDDINILTPATSIIGSDQYDKFLENNNLDKIAFAKDVDYLELKKAFLNAQLSDDLYQRLRKLLTIMKRPLAVRSSGLLEDSLYQPFAGIYETYIVPNVGDEQERLEQLANAIKMVYASVFSPKSRSYIRSINYKIEEEKMAVVIQEVVGSKHDNFYYPHISGVAQSYNFYPFSHIKPEDGYATIALGLGTYVVEGEKAYHFCPRYPKLQNYRLKDLVDNSQTHFYAVDLRLKKLDFLKGENAGLAKLDIWDAERHGTLKHLASVYDKNGERLIPGIDKPGPRVLDFANILKFNYIPLAETIRKMLNIAKEAMGTPVEIEFAIDLKKDKQGRASFFLLQIKPLLGSGDDFNIDESRLDKDSVVLFTDTSMGNGKIDFLRHVLFVSPRTFDKSRTEQIAEEIGEINEKMLTSGERYILIGPGRWGTRDKWIGIPVNWGQISNAKVIVEASLENFPLEGSSGSHFFHNVISMNIGYFTVLHDNPKHILRWDILEQQKVIYQTDYVKLVEFPEPLIVKMDGKKRIAVIMERDDSPAEA